MLNALNACVNLHEHWAEINYISWWIIRYSVTL